MLFKDLLNSVWQNIVAEKWFFIKTIIINALVCAIFLVVPAFTTTFIGALFAEACESTMGLLEFLEKNVGSIEKTISQVTSVLLVISFIFAIITAFSVAENDMQTYRIYRRTGMSENMILFQAFIQNSLVCVVWGVLSIFIAKIVSVFLSGVIGTAIMLSFANFLIMLSAEIVLVLMVTFVKIKFTLFNSRQETLK